MHPLLRFAETAYIEAQHLLPRLTNYSNPRDLIARLVKKGELIRLKNGFYVISEKIEKNRVPFEQIANLLYGPSYVSFEWALAHYGMIPEGVYVVTSACYNKSASFQTPLATFDYTYLSLARYVEGIDMLTNEAGNYLMATPEKALADLVCKKCQHLNSKELLTDLLEGRRMEQENLKQLDKHRLQTIAENYRSKAVTNLVHAIGLL